VIKKYREIDNAELLPFVVFEYIDGRTPKVFRDRNVTGEGFLVYSQAHRVTRYREMSQLEFYISGSGIFKTRQPIIEELLRQEVIEEIEQFDEREED